MCNEVSRLCRNGTIEHDTVCAVSCHWLQGSGRYVSILLPISVLDHWYRKGEVSSVICRGERIRQRLLGSDGAARDSNERWCVEGVLDKLCVNRGSADEIRDMELMSAPYNWLLSQYSRDSNSSEEDVEAKQCSRNDKLPFLRLLCPVPCSLLMTESHDHVV